MDFKRDKEIPSKTFRIPTDLCGNLFLTLGWQENKIIECRGVIGKAGTCCNTFLDSFCKIMSILLQSDMPRYKIIKKIKKQFVEVNCGQGFEWENKKYASCVDLVSQSVVDELAKQI